MSYIKYLSDIDSNDESTKSLREKTACLLENLQKHAETFKPKTTKTIYNINSELSLDCHQINSNIENTIDKQNLINKIFTDNKLQNELLSYELQHFKSDTFLPDDEILNTINKFNPLIEDYLENHIFIHNTKSTTSFIIKDKYNVYSNSICLKDKKNIIIKKHLNSLQKYLNRNFKSDFKSYIEQDDKFDLCWIFIKQTK